MQMLNRTIVALIALLSLNSCRDVDKVTDAITASINKIVAQSEGWQATLKELEADLTDKKEKIVAAQVHDLLLTGIANTGVEFRCNADFIAESMVSGLQRIRAALNSKYSLPSEGHFCMAIPSDIDLARDPSVRRDLQITGYNLRLEDIRVFVVDSKGNRREIAARTHQVAVPTPYAVTVNLSDNGVALSDTDRQLQFQLIDNVMHGINILAKTRRYSVSKDDSTAREVNGSEGGDSHPYSDECGAGEVGIGLTGRAGDSIDHIALRCAVLLPDGTLGAVSTTPNRGGTGGFNPFDETCRGGGVLVGMGANQSFNYNRVSGLTGQCQSPEAVAARTGGNITFIGGPNWGDWAGNFHMDKCMTGDVITGITERVGSGDGVGGDGMVIKHLGFLCRHLVAERP